LLSSSRERTSRRRGRRCQLIASSPACHPELATRIAIAIRFRAGGVPRSPASARCDAPDQRPSPIGRPARKSPGSSRAFASRTVPRRLARSRSSHRRLHGAGLAPRVLGRRLAPGYIAYGGWHNATTRPNDARIPRNLPRAILIVGVRSSSHRSTARRTSRRPRADRACWPPPHTRRRPRQNRGSSGARRPTPYVLGESSRPSLPEPRAQ